MVVVDDLGEFAAIHLLLIDPHVDGFGEFGVLEDIASDDFSDSRSPSERMSESETQGGMKTYQFPEPMMQTFSEFIV